MPCWSLVDCIPTLSFNRCEVCACLCTYWLMRAGVHPPKMVQSMRLRGACSQPPPPPPPRHFIRHLRHCRGRAPPPHKRRQPCPDREVYGTSVMTAASCIRWYVCWYAGWCVGCYVGRYACWYATWLAPLAPRHRQRTCSASSLGRSAAHAGMRSRPSPAPPVMWRMGEQWGMEGMRQEGG